MFLSKFLDPKNDFAFKRIFGTECNKDILIPFLNDMLEFKGGVKIKDQSLPKKAKLPITRGSFYNILMYDHDHYLRKVSQTLPSRKQQNQCARA